MPHTRPQKPGKPRHFAKAQRPKRVREGSRERRREGFGALAGGGMSSRLPHAVGYRWAKQLSFTCDPIDAATALRIGLVNEVVPHEALLARSMALADSIARHDPALLATAKQVLERGSLTTLADNIFLEREALAASRMRGEARWKT